MFDWQTMAALLVVAAAAAVLTRRLYRLLRGRAATGCSACPSSRRCGGQAAVSSQGKSLPLVSLGRSHEGTQPAARPTSRPH
ncbi:MAG: hypothetical protein KDA45_17460 [Planctomycetales bacterium]|nr:hypothetical protein [Planctomycetales bacterium]